MPFHLDMGSYTTSHNILNGLVYTRKHEAHFLVDLQFSVLMKNTLMENEEYIIQRNNYFIHTEFLKLRTVVNCTQLFMNLDDNDSAALFLHK